MLCGSLRNRLHAWLHDYVRLQFLVIILIYAQIGCSLIGSLGALYNGVLLINLAIALFGIVAIVNSSQSLGRTYAVLVFISIVIDISWFILFSKEIWNMTSTMYQPFYVFSVKLTMAMEICGFIVRILSCMLWLQIYRLGAATVNNSFTRPPGFGSQNSFIDPPFFHRQGSNDAEIRNSFLESPRIGNRRSRSDEILGDNVDEAAFYSPPVDGNQSNIVSSTNAAQMMKHNSAGDIYKGSTSSAAEASHKKSPLSESLESLDASLR